MSNETKSIGQAAAEKLSLEWGLVFRKYPQLKKDIVMWFDKIVRERGEKWHLEKSGKMLPPNNLEEYQVWNGKRLVIDGLTGHQALSIVEAHNVSLNATPTPQTDVVNEQIGLAPCPFCGSKDVGLPFDDGRPNNWITCNQCEADGPIVQVEERGEHSIIAEDRWNKRAPLISSPEKQPRDQEKTEHTIIDTAEGEVLSEPSATQSPTATKEPNPCNKIFDHKWLDPKCVEHGCQSLRGEADTKALLLLRKLRGAISDFGGHGIPGFTDRVTTLLMLDEVDQFLKAIDAAMQKEGEKK